MSKKVMHKARGRENAKIVSIISLFSVSLSMRSSSVVLRRYFVPMLALLTAVSFSLIVATRAYGQVVAESPKNSEGAYIYCSNEMECEQTAAALRGTLPDSYTKITGVKDFGPGIVGGKVGLDGTVVSMLFSGLEFSGPTFFTASLYDEVNDVTADVYVKVYFARTANTAPEANPDTLEATVVEIEDAGGFFKRDGFMGGVLKNDYDPDFDFLTATKASDPSHGTLVLEADGGFTYTPGPTFTGTDSFTYSVCDVYAACSAPSLVGIAIPGSIGTKSDFDGDGILNADDLCPRTSNPSLLQPDADGDGKGDHCDEATTLVNSGASNLTVSYKIHGKTGYSLRVLPSSTMTVYPSGDNSIRFTLAGNGGYVVSYPDGDLATTESTAVHLSNGDDLKVKTPGLTAAPALSQIQNLTATNNAEVYNSPDPTTYGIAIPGLVMELTAEMNYRLAWTQNYTAGPAMHTEGGLSLAVGGYTYPQADFTRSADSIDCYVPAQTGEQGRLIITANVLVTPTGEDKQTTCVNIAKDLALAAKDSTIIAFPSNSTFTAKHGSLTVSDIAFPIGKQVIAAYKPATFGANGITGSADTLWVKPAAGSSFKIDDSNALRPVITNLSTDKDLEVFIGTDFTYSKDGVFVQPVGAEPVVIAPNDTVIFGKEPSKVILCHVTGQSKKSQTISVDEHAVQALLERGDTLGACDPLAMDQRTLAMVVTIAGGLTAVGATHVLRRKRSRRNKK